MAGKEHPKYQIPDTPHAKIRYERALKHARAAKAEGKSTEEIHAIFKRVIEFDTKDVEKLSKEGKHGQYRSAVLHARMALEQGKTSAEAHAVFKRFMAGDVNHDAHVKA